MAGLEHITDIIDLEIKSIQEIISESSKKKAYNKWIKREEKLIEEKIAPSLSAYILYEHQFNNKSMNTISQEFNLTGKGLIKLSKKMSIPIRNENLKKEGSYYQRHHIMKNKKRKKILKENTIDLESRLIVEIKNNPNEYNEENIKRVSYLINYQKKYPEYGNRYAFLKEMKEYKLFYQINYEWKGLEINKLSKDNLTGGKEFYNAFKKYINSQTTNRKERKQLIYKLAA